jgi:hypothetical protein
MSCADYCCQEKGMSMSRFIACGKSAPKGGSMARLTIHQPNCKLVSAVPFLKCRNIRITDQSCQTIEKCAWFMYAMLCCQGRAVGAMLR